MSLFHLAINVTDLDETRAFYTDILGAKEGRYTDTWVDFDFFGHQLSCHLGVPLQHADTGKVGDHMVPMPHFGVVLPMPQWRDLAARLEGKVTFALSPQIRFSGEPGEQGTMFFFDPSGNPIEIKGIENFDQAFAT